MRFARVDTNADRVDGLHRMNQLTWSTGLRLAQMIVMVLGTSSCADSFAVKNEAVPVELERQLQALAVPAAELKITKGALNVKTRSAPPPEGVLKVPMYYENGIPFIKVSLNGRKAKKFMFDTGATFSVFDAEQAVEFGMRTVPQVRPTMSGVLGKEPGMAALIPTVQIGSWKLENLPCILRMQRTAWGSGILKEHLGISVLGVHIAAEVRRRRIHRVAGVVDDVVLTVTAAVGVDVHRPRGRQHHRVEAFRRPVEASHRRRVVDALAEEGAAVRAVAQAVGQALHCQEELAVVEGSGLVEGGFHFDGTNRGGAEVAEGTGRGKCRVTSEQ